MIPSSLATIVVTPRERYSRARESFASVAANTPGDHRIIYVVGGAPPEIEKYLRQTCTDHRYEFICRPQFLPPNTARNLGLAAADSKYIAFLDNDVVVRPGWLDALIDCAEQEKADIVSPLVLMGEPREELFHSFGGLLIIEELGNKKRVREQHHSAPVGWEGTPRSRRIKSDYSEFHCALVRRSVFDRIGPLDEKILGAAEHIDLALHIRDLGGRGFAEPASVVTYLPTAFVVGDLSTYAQRWSEDWYTPTMAHLVSKWNLDPDSLLLSDYRSSFHELRERCLLPLELPQAAQPMRKANLQLAQTIVQLLDQMKCLGYPDDAIIKVNDAYWIAIQLFSGSFRSSGRTFLAHLVGTASIMSILGANPAVVAAALLHATYVQGRFPNGFDKSVDMMRRWLNRRSGDAIETLVFLYSRLDLDEVAAFVPGDMDRMPIDLANAILIRMANGIEDRISRDHHYFDSSSWIEAGNAVIDKWIPMFDAVANKLGCDPLAELFAEVIDGTKPDPNRSPPHPPRPLNFFVDSGAGEMQPLPLRNISEAKGLNPFRSLNADRKGRPLPIRLKEIVANNGGLVVQERNGLELRTSTKPWAYSASLDLYRLRMMGPAIIEISLWVKRGTLGLLVLERGSSEHMLLPELRVDEAQEPTTLKIEIPEMEEAGGLMFRGWPDGDLPARAIVSAISIISVY